MTKVLTHMCMSLDGFVAQPDDDPGELFDWYWGGDVVVPSAQESMTLLGRCRKRSDVAGAHLGLRCADRRPSAVRPDRRLGRQPPGRCARRRRDPSAAARGRGGEISTDDFHRQRRRGDRRRRSRLPATSSSRSPAPTSSNRRSTSASSTSSASARSPCSSVPASATSATSSAVTSCSRIPSWSKAPARSTCATPCGGPKPVPDQGEDAGIPSGPHPVCLHGTVRSKISAALSEGVML